ncbi:MAG: DUF3604 domain-containing protein [Armatimonadota bacterium]
MRPERAQLPEVVRRLLEPQAVGLKVTADSTAAAGAPVRVTVEVRNGAGATATGFTAQVPLVLIGAGGHSRVAEVCVTEGVGHADIRVAEAGIYRAQALVSEGLRATSDPIEITTKAPALRLLWGDIHAHIRERRAQALISEADELMGPPTVQAALAWARDVAGLHFAAITDHDLKLTDAEWVQTIEDARVATEDGRFVAFPGYEWGDSSGIAMNYGHRQVLYRRSRVRGVEPVPLLRCTEPPTHTAPGLYAALRAAVPVADVLVVPHHTARGGGQTWMNWDYFDPELERLCEVFSIWGSSERMGEPYPIRYLPSGGYFGAAEARGHHLQDGLARGYRFGFTAGSESHDGRPGGALVHGPHVIAESDLLAPPGITGVWAESLSRDGIFDALRARRCYATTGARMIVRFALGETPMGGEVAADGLSGPPELRTEVIGTAPIASCELVRGNEAIDNASSATESLAVTLRDGRRAEPGDCYYLRVRQRDGQMAWASPIFIR